MRKIIKATSLCLILTLGLSCETPKAGLGNGTGSPEARQAFNRLTKGGTTFPTGEEVTKLVSNPGSLPQGDSCEGVVTETAEPVISTKGQSPITGSSCKHYDKFIRAGVPEAALKQALTFYEKNKSKFKNQRYISIADYSVRSDKKRFFQLDMLNGTVHKEKVSHGSGSTAGNKWGDSNHDGYLDRCRIPSGKSGGKHNQYAMTRPGFFKTSGFYNSWSHDPKNSQAKQPWPVLYTSPRSNGMKMHGLTPGVNDKAMEHGVVMHEAFYNQGKIMGRSFGCPAFPPSKGRKIMADITGGSLYYSYVPVNEASCKADMDKVRAQVPDWQRMCK